MSEIKEKLSLTRDPPRGTCCTDDRTAKEGRFCACAKVHAYATGEIIMDACYVVPEGDFF